MKTKIESVFELAGAFSEHVGDKEAMSSLLYAVRLLELRLTQKDAADVIWQDEGGRYLRMDLADVLYWFMVVCGKKGVCLDCLTDEVVAKLRVEMGRAGVNILIMKPTIVNVDNTGKK
jgi:hypothetical protein